MYLHKLEKDEKTAFLSLAKHLAQVDDSRIDAREKYMIQYMCAEMGTDYESADKSPFDVEKFAKVFFREEARRVALLEAVGVCRGSGDINASQKKVLDALAAKFSLGGDFIARAEQTIRKQLEVMNEFDKLIAGAV